MSLEIVPTGAALGAEVRGIDLASPLSSADLDAIKEAWADHLVLLFRDQKLSDDDLIRFSRNFGFLRRLW